MRATCFAFLMCVTIASPPARGDQGVDFDTQVMPVLSRQGCNAGSCHGAAIGRGGFKLSLLGSGAAADHQTIVQQLEGRRVNLTDPDKSLLLRKPSEQVGHEGGLVLPEDSLAFDLVRRWIAEGAMRRRDRELKALTITPDHTTLARPGDSVTIRVAADFGADQSSDVTTWTVFRPADPDAVSIEPADTVDQGGLRFTVHRRGVHIVIARFLDRVMPIRLTVPMHDAAPSSEKPSPTGNRIDDFVDAQLRKLNLPVSPTTDDWAFVRRVTLDLAGRLPTADEARSFAQDPSAEKRSRLIRRLLDSESFAQYWALKWANGLGIDSKQLQPEGAASYHRWLAEQLHADAPMNQTARMMLTSTGDGYVEGAVNFLRSGSGPGDLAERASRILMGVRLQCANCHDHPLDHWQQDDYHGMAAIFAKISRGRVVTIAPRGEVTHPVTGQAAVPRIPGDRYLDDSVDGRVALADWLTSPENPYFAKAMVNRVWQQLMGRGLVDPIDDLRATNPATHPELLEWLADDFVTHGFRIKHTIESICNSLAYGRVATTVAGNEVDSQFYSHAIIRPLEAEVVADAITDVTGVPLRVAADVLPRAITLTDNRMELPSLDVLGRCDREESCSSTGDSSVSLVRSLHLINGDLINLRVHSPDGRLHALLASNRDNAGVLSEIFLWTLTRPDVAESQYWRQQLAGIENTDAQGRAEFFEDVLWSLMTSQSFATNH